MVTHVDATQPQKIELDRLQIKNLITDNYKDMRVSLLVVLVTGHGSGCSCRHAGSVARIYRGHNWAGNARGPGHNNRRRRPGFRHRRRDSEYPAPARPNCSIAASYESRV